jgi:preprotein translocase subunit Sss1
MSGSNEAIQEKLEQARRLLQQVSDPTTTESLKALIAEAD